MSPAKTSERSASSLIRSAIEGIKGPASLPAGDDIGGLNLMMDLVFDSLDVLNFIFKIELDTGLTIPVEDIEEKDLFILGNLATYLEENTIAK